jgi:hypothetical protein
LGFLGVLRKSGRRPGTQGAAGWRVPPDPARHPANPNTPLPRAAQCALTEARPTRCPSRRSRTTCHVQGGGSCRVSAAHARPQRRAQALVRPVPLVATPVATAVNKSPGRPKKRRSGGRACQMLACVFPCAGACLLLDGVPFVGLLPVVFGCFQRVVVVRPVRGDRQRFQETRLG